MASEPSIRRYKSWYANLLCLYPKAHRERFGEGMEKTFNDLCRERVKAEKGLFGFALWTFFETFAAIVRENATIIMRNKSIMRIAIGTGLILLSSIARLTSFAKRAHSWLGKLGFALQLGCRRISIPKSVESTFGSHIDVPAG